MIDKIKFSRQIEEISEVTENLRTKLLQTMTEWMVETNLTAFPITTRHPYRNLTLTDGNTLCVEGPEKGTTADLLDLASLQSIYDELKEAIAKSLEK